MKRVDPGGSDANRGIDENCLPAKRMNVRQAAEWWRGICEALKEAEDAAATPAPSPAPAQPFRAYVQERVDGITQSAAQVAPPATPALPIVSEEREEPIVMAAREHRNNRGFYFGAWGIPHS